VTRDPNGWELGVHPITLFAPFLEHFGPVTSNLEGKGEEGVGKRGGQMRLQFVHADHVVLPLDQQGKILVDEQGWFVLGKTEHCAIQGVWKRGRVLTLQGHAE